MAAVLRRAALAAALAAMAASRAGAQASPTIELSDPAYADAQHLLDAGVARGAAIGQRPWSRRTFARIASDGCPDAAPPPATGAAPLRLACARLRERFGEDLLDLERTRSDLRVQPLAALSAQLLYTDVPSRPYAGNGLGEVEADARPLTEGREGRPYRRGANAVLESEHWARVGSRLTLQLHPMLLARAPTGGGSDATLRLHTGAARLVLGNVTLTAGRELTDWGNAPGGGLFFSANAPAMDLVRIASEQPFRLPWLLGRLGPASAVLQAADVGPSAANGSSRLVAYKVSVQPSPAVELGATFANHYGGLGTRGVGLGRRLVDLAPFVDVFRHHADSTEFESDKKLGADARVRLPGLANATLFGELALEDFDVHRLRSVFSEDAAWIAGVLFPATDARATSVQLSYHATGIRFYEHHLVRNGYATSRFLVGDPLGPDASGWYGTLGWEGERGLAIAAHAAYESRGNSEYVGAYTQPGLQGLVFRVATPRPAELRRRVSIDARLQRGNGLFLLFGAGVERASGPPIAAGGGRTDGLLEARVAMFR